MKKLVKLIRSKLSGKKTYSIAIIAVIIAILQATGILPPELPSWAWKILIALGGGGFRAGMKKDM